MDALSHTVKKILNDDSMSVALFSLFLICIVAQGISGWFAYNSSLQAGHFPEITLGVYLVTGNFLDGIFSNWQAAILQLAVLIAFGSVLRQKGAAHSRKTDSPSHRTLEWKHGPRETLHEWLYANSLSLAFVALFATTFVLHLWFGEWNTTRIRHCGICLRRHSVPMQLRPTSGSRSFSAGRRSLWLSVSISSSVSSCAKRARPESKPVGASDEQTGEVNE